jgi:hypothetical protein
MVDPGLDLHEWQTRWQELEDAFADSPEQMLAARGFQLDEPVTVGGEDPDIVRQFVAARELARLVEQGEAEPEDVEIAVEGYRDIYEYLVMDRAPP